MTEQITVPKQTWDAMRGALETIIQYNRDHALDQYGDAEKAERWACVVKAREALTAANAVSEPQEAIAWEATTPGYIKYVTDKQYRSYSEAAKRWYKPYKCSSCHPQATEPAGYMLVPVNATPEMIAAAEQVEDLYRRGTPETWGSVYRAMLAAAPEAKQ